MPRFAFPVPGRKKHAAAKQAANDAASSKAQKILGSAPLSIDSQKNWDGRSTSGVSVTVTDTYSPTHQTRSHIPPMSSGPVASRSEWGEDSEIIPRYHQNSNFVSNDDDHSEITTALRAKPSSSTIRSWYDKTKQPLSVSQQTSSSAIARGPPSKAQRMLDMDNSLVSSKSKKKPAKLDLSRLTPNSTSKEEPDSWDRYILGPDLATKSPSMLSQLSAGPASSRLGLHKQPTLESLRQRPSITVSDPSRPPSSGSGAGSARFAKHPNGVPDLYGHYEQMSLRQIMDLEASEAADEEEFNQPALDPVKLHPQTLQASPRQRQYDTQQKRMSRSTQSSKPMHGSPAPSISSRYTRTSKASKRTDTSFQEADLLSKSVLSLSSDSEDDDESIEEPLRSPSSVFARPPSDFDDHLASLDQWPAQYDSPSVTSETRFKTGKRASFAPTHTYLPLPAERPKVVVTGFSDTSPSVASSIPPRSSSGVSTGSSSSTGSAVTWQSQQQNFGVQEARAVTMLSAQRPAEHENAPPSTSGTEGSSDWLQESLTRESIDSTAEQLTPPLSPSSVDFYIRSAHSSIDGPSGGDNRFMAVSRQEELLLAALRQKRQLMRQSFIDEEVSAKVGRHSSILSEGHKSGRSSGTITQGFSDFDFPTPPKAKTENSASKRISQRPESVQKSPKSTRQRDSTTPSIKSKTGILKTPTGESASQPRRWSQMSEEWPISPGTLMSWEGFPVTLDAMADKEKESRLSQSFDAANDYGPILQPRCYSGGLSARRKSSHALPRKGHRPYPSVVPEEPASPIATQAVHFEDDEVYDEEDHGIPRPDSPISPDAFPSIPTTRVTIDKQMARLSAFGSADLGSKPSWWDNAE